MDRILIVEDESIIALNMERTLQRLGYQVVGTAGNSAEALLMARAERPDLVLMDINLGAGDDGIDTATRICAQRPTAVIYLTAYSEEGTLNRASETRPYGYLLKPFSERELHATIQMALVRHRADIALADGEQLLRLALETAGMGCWDLDVASGRLHTQAFTDDLLGLETGQSGGDWATLLDQIAPEYHEAVRLARAEAVERGGLMAVEFKGRRADGSTPWLRMQARSHVRPGEPPRLIGVAQDITARREAEGGLRQAATVFSSAREAIFIADIGLELNAVNAAFTDLTGHAAADVLGRRVGPWLLQACSGESRLDFASALQTRGHWQGELVGVRAGGERFPVWLSATSVPDENGVHAQVVGIFSDIGQLRRAERDLFHLAHHDPLTGLPNRLLATDRLDQAILRARRKRWQTAVMMIDLDNFKQINDTLGHSAGDELLCAVAGRLEAVLREEDTVARLGGDEFILIIENIARRESIATLARLLLERIGEPFTVNGSEVRSGASLGIAVFPKDAQDRDALIRASDTAMYAAKEGGRNRVAFYAPEMTDKLSRQIGAEQDLRRGLAAGELRVHYQPQIALCDMRLVGMEALVRWQHPQRGLLSALEVVPLAEESGQIMEVGRFVLRTVCRQIRSWIDLGLDCPRVAVNVSVQQLRSGDFPRIVAAALAESGIAADRLELELTESTLQQESVCLPAMLALQELGIALAIDDFGTGYSSLASLKRLPVSRCKIDRVFVSEIVAGSDDAAIAGAIIDLGHRLSMKITAEGVETMEQLELLRAMGCDDVQGYLFATPMDPGEMRGLLHPGFAPGQVEAPVATSPLSADSAC